MKHTDSILALLLLACGGDPVAVVPPPPPPPVVANITVRRASSLAFLPIGPGVTMVLEAAVQDANGTEIADAPLLWESSNPSVMTVTPSVGRSANVIAVGIGDAVISARSGSVRRDTLFTVIDYTVANLELDELPRLHVYDTARLTFRVRNRDGIVVPLPRVIEIECSNLAVLECDTRSVMAWGLGTATVTVRVDGFAASIVVTVE